MLVYAQGANKWNHADTDAFGHLPLREQHIVGRFYIYDSTMNRLPSSGTIGFNDLASLSKSGAATVACNYLDRLPCFDFIMGAQYLMGSIGTYHASALFPPTDPQADLLKATINKWTGFYKRHRALRPSGAAGLIIGDMIHLRRPDGRSFSSVLHLSSDTSSAERGLLALINPTSKTIKETITTPLYYAGIKLALVGSSEFADLVPRIGTRNQCNSQ